MTHPADASIVPTGRPAGGNDPAGRPVQRRARAIVAVLAVTQTVGYGALYYPWLVVNDPSTNQFVEVPPSGHIIGIYAR